MEHAPGVEMGNDVKQQRLALDLIYLYSQLFRIKGDIL